MEHPEILAWEKLWSDGQHESYRYIYEAGTSARKDLQVGFHIWHLNSFSPFWSAEEDYSRLAAHADFFKVVVYNNCGGPRLVSYIENVQRTLFRDLDAAAVLGLHQALLHYSEKPVNELATSGLSSDYVYRETLRAREGVAGRAVVYAGIDIDIPTAAGQKKTAPEDVRETVKSAFRAGADGVILSRKYSEMRLGNLAAAGQGLREAGVI